MAIYTISRQIPDKEDHIDDFERDTGIEVIDHDVNSLDELEDEHDDFQQMTYKQRKVSNAKSEEVYGMNNTERYDKLKSKFLKTSKNTDDHITVQGESNIIIQDTEIKYCPIVDYDSKIEFANNWSNSSMIFIITPKATMSDLEQLWNKWNSMPLKHRRDSDMKSTELFALTNKEHYELIKSHFLKKGEGIVDDNSTDSNTKNISSNDGTIQNQSNIIESYINKGDMFKASIELLKLKSIKTENLYESSMVSIIENKFKDLINNDVNCYYDKLNHLPFFTPDQLTDMGVFYSDSYYNTLPDNEYLDDEKTITNKDWFDCYQRSINGFLNENYNNYTSLWINKLRVLYSDFDSIKESNDIKRINSRKQSILELGWNPEIDFNVKVLSEVSNNTKQRLKDMYSREMYDIREFYESSSETLAINESLEDTRADKYPLFIVLSYSGDSFSKIITKYTKSKFSHSALGLDIELDKLYSYNVVDKGFAIENIDRYRRRNSNSEVAVFCTFISKKELTKVKLNLDYLLANKNKTHYSVTNILGIGLNKEFEFDINMICSQFVDKILKMVNVDYTNKPSGLVTPNDFYINKNNRVYKLYEGNIMGYNPNKARTLIRKLQQNKNYIQEQESIINESTFIQSLNEYSIDSLINLHNHYNVLSEECSSIYESYVNPYTNIYYYNEAKELPVQFDKEGNLLIKRMGRLDYEAEYAKSHKLLLVYEESNNIEGIKYELCKLWFMNSLIEKKIYNENDSSNRKDLYKVRARILNDFNKYLKIVNSKDKEFNFTEYYNDTPFSDATIKISKHTIKHGISLLKTITGSLVQ